MTPKLRFASQAVKSDRRLHWREIIAMGHCVGMRLMKATRCRCCDEQSYESNSSGIFTCRYCDFISPDGIVVPELREPGDHKLSRIKQIIDRLRKGDQEDEPEDRS